MSDELLAAADHGDHRTLRSLLRRGVPVDFKDEYDNTALNLALAGEYADATQLLLDEGANVELCTLDVTPLCLVARVGHVIGIKMLLAAGANVNATKM